MLRRWEISLLAMVLLLPSLTCTRLPEAPRPENVTLGTEELPALDSIPSGWGRLVAATTTPVYQGMIQLWFADENGKVRMVPFNIQTSQLVRNAVVFPRR